MQNTQRDTQANDIDLVIQECRFHGDCQGTCPKCEEEVNYLEQQLKMRRMSGKSIVLAGLSAGVIAALSPVTTEASTPPPHHMAINPMVRHWPTDTITIRGTVMSNDTLPDGTKYSVPLTHAKVLNTHDNSVANVDPYGYFEIKALPGDKITISCSNYYSESFMPTLENPFMAVTLNPYDPRTLAGAYANPRPYNEHSFTLKIVDENGAPICPHCIKLTGSFDSDGEMKPICSEWINESCEYIVFWKAFTGWSVFFNLETPKGVYLRVGAEGYEGDTDLFIPHPATQSPYVITLKRTH